MRPKETETIWGLRNSGEKFFFFTDRIMTELVLDVVTEKEFSKALLQRNSWETCTMIRVWYAKE